MRGLKRWRRGDCSIQVHSCHSPMREVEVLLDTLLGLFESSPSPLSSESLSVIPAEAGIQVLSESLGPRLRGDDRKGMMAIEGLEPRDVLVMAPDIEAYAPFIRAVFDMDRGIRAASPTASRTGRSGGAPSWRMRSWLCSICPDSALRHRWSWTCWTRRRCGPGSAWTRRMCARSMPGLQARISGGAGTVVIKKQMGLPGFEENTWGFGLKRLLLGYAMAGGDELFEGIAPLPAWTLPRQNSWAASWTSWRGSLRQWTSSGRSGGLASGHRCSSRSSTTCLLRMRRPFVSFCG